MSNFLEKKRYEGVRFDVISFTRGWVGVQFLGKKRYITLEWPPKTEILSQAVFCGGRHNFCKKSKQLISHVLSKCCKLTLF